MQIPNAICNPKSAKSQGVSPGAWVPLRTLLGGLQSVMKCLHTSGLAPEQFDYQTLRPLPAFTADIPGRLEAD